MASNPPTGSGTPATPAPPTPAKPEDPPYTHHGAGHHSHKHEHAPHGLHHHRHHHEGGETEHNHGADHPLNAANTDHVHHHMG